MFFPCTVLSRLGGALQNGIGVKSKIQTPEGRRGAGPTHKGRRGARILGATLATLMLTTGAGCSRGEATINTTSDPTSEQQPTPASGTDSIPDDGASTDSSTTAVESGGLIEEASPISGDSGLSGEILPESETLSEFADSTATKILDLSYNAITAPTPDDYNGLTFKPASEKYEYYTSTGDGYDGQSSRVFTVVESNPDEDGSVIGVELDGKIDDGSVFDDSRPLVGVYVFVDGVTYSIRQNPSTGHWYSVVTRGEEGQMEYMNDQRGWSSTRPPAPTNEEAVDDSPRDQLAVTTIIDATEAAGVS